MSCSIIIPTHNRPNLLVEAVHSALVACPENGEVLVVDDRSRVAARDILSDITDDRLTVIASPGPAGISGTRNAGVEAARHPIVAFLDDDDLMMEHHISRILAIADTYPGAHWGFCNAHWYNVQEDRKTVESMPLRDGFVPANADPRHSIASAPRGFWARRQTLLDVGLFDVDWSIDEDTDLSLRLLAKGYRPWFTAEPGVLMRTNRPAQPDMGQFTAANSRRASRAYRQTYERHHRTYAPSSRWRYFLATRYLRHAAREGVAVPDASKVIRKEPMAPVLMAYLVVKTLRYRGASALAK